MQVKISKTLEGIIARAAFNTTKAGIDHSLRRCGRQQAANPGAAGNPAHEAVRYRAARHRRQPRKPKPANPAPQELFPTPAAGNRSCLRAPFPYYRRHPSEGASLPREKGRKPFQNTPKPVSGIARQKFHPHNPLRDNTINADKQVNIIFGNNTPLDRRRIKS